MPLFYQPQFSHLFSGSHPSTWSLSLSCLLLEFRQPSMTGFLVLCLPTPWSEPQFPHLGSGFSYDQ